MDVRFLDVHTAAPEQLARWEQWLAPEKRQRIDRLPPKQRLLSVCGDGLAREMLAEMLGITPETIVFTENENGKPVTDGAFFSISHSGSLVACAVSDCPVGLDIEHIRPVPPRLSRFLEEEQPEYFWQLWTRREAALKCRGDGLGAWKRSGEEGVTFSAITAPLGYVAAVCKEK